MKVETFTAAILRKMSGIGKSQTKFIIHIISLFLSMRNRCTYLMMERYGTYREQSYRQNFEKDFDFKTFNTTLIKQYCGRELIWIFDPSYISKSGKKTPYSGYFWSGCADKMKWGLEISCLAIGDVENHTAMHYHAQQTPIINRGKKEKSEKNEESLRAYYARSICSQAQEMQKITKILDCDAFFSKKPFVDSVCQAGFTLVSRLQSNIYLRYAYEGEQTGGKGRPKQYAGKIDIKNVSTQHFNILKSDDEEIVYQGIAHVRSLKRWCRVVIINTLKEGEVHKAVVYFSTDTQMSGEKVYQYYKLRCQIEFIFRDTKNHLGLEHSQSRQEKALDFHFNIALSTLNVAKALHWLSIPKNERGPFSMADIKTQYVNELLLDRLISIYGKDPSVEKNNPKIRQLYQLGRIAA
jgi:hypothetical protein